MLRPWFHIQFLNLVLLVTDIQLLYLVSLVTDFQLLYLVSLVTDNGTGVHAFLLGYRMAQKLQAHPRSQRPTREEQVGKGRGEQF